MLSLKIGLGALSRFHLPKKVVPTSDAATASREALGGLPAFQNVEHLGSDQCTRDRVRPTHLCPLADRKLPSSLFGGVWLTILRQRIGKLTSQQRRSLAAVSLSD